MWLNRALQVIIIEGNGLLSVLQFLFGGLVTRVAFRQCHGQYLPFAEYLSTFWSHVDNFYYS